MNLRALVQIFRPLTLFLLVVSGLLVGINYVHSDRKYENPAIRTKVETFEALRYKLTGVDEQVTTKVSIADSWILRWTGAVGVCIPPLNLIILDREFWDSASYYTREQLLLHELGHCVLGKYVHEPVQYMRTRGGLKCRNSMMSPRMLPLPCYMQERTYYLEELFGVADKK